MEWMRKFGEELVIDICASAISVMGFCGALCGMMILCHTKNVEFPAVVLLGAAVVASISLVAVEKMKIED